MCGCWRSSLSTVETILKFSIDDLAARIPRQGFDEFELLRNLLDHQSRLAQKLDHLVEPERIARIVTDDGSAAPFARLCVRKSNDRDFSYLGVPRQQAFPGKGRFLPGGTLVVRNVLSGGGGNAA